MKPLSIFFTCVLCFTASFVQAESKTDPLAKKYPLLARLTPPQKNLPSGCRTPEIPKDVPQLTGLKNLAITENSKLFAVVDERLAKLLDVKKINALYFGGYIQKNELGIVGWNFKTVEDAKKSYKDLTASYGKEKDRFRFWQVDKNVVWLWRDPGTTDLCFQFFENYINSQLKKSMKKGSK